MDISSSTSQKKINSMSTISLNNQKGHSNGITSKIKDFFVIPLRK